jgi:hypothetical protein
MDRCYAPRCRRQLLVVACIDVVARVTGRTFDFCERRQTGSTGTDHSRRPSEPDAPQTSKFPIAGILQSQDRSPDRQISHYGIFVVHSTWLRDFGRPRSSLPAIQAMTVKSWRRLNRFPPGNPSSSLLESIARGRNEETLLRPNQVKHCLDRRRRVTF